MTPEELCRQVEAGNVPPIVLVVGAEQYLQNKVVQALRSAALKGSVPGLNEDNFIATETPVDSIISAARTLPMLARKRFVYVRQVERWETASKGEADALDRIATYAADPVSSCVFVLSGLKLDGRKKLSTVAKKGNWWVACEPVSRNGIPGFIAARSAERGVHIASGAAELIVEVVGTDLAALVDAIERLCLFVGTDGKIDEDAVGTCLVRIKASTVWELVGAISRRDLGRALEALDAVYDPKDRGLPIVGTWAWSARQMLRFESAIRAGMSPTQAAQAAGAPPFRANELADQCKRLPRQELERWLDVIARVDMALKGGSKRPPKAILEHAILSLCKTQRPARASSQYPA